MCRRGFTPLTVLAIPRRLTAAFAAIFAIALITPASAQQTQAAGRGRGAAVEPIPIVLANDKIELTTLAHGGRFAKLLLREGEPLNAFGALGHFLALDGFGAPSPEEAALGMPFHGEAGRQIFEVDREP